MRAFVRAFVCALRACVGTYGNLWELHAWELMGTHGNFVHGNLWEFRVWDLRAWELTGTQCVDARRFYTVFLRCAMFLLYVVTMQSVFTLRFCSVLRFSAVYVYVL